MSTFTITIADKKCSHCGKTGAVEENAAGPLPFLYIEKYSRAHSQAKKPNERGQIPLLKMTNG